MRVRALRKAFIDNVHRNEGDEFEYNGAPNSNLEPLDKSAAADKPKQHESAAADRPQGAAKKDDSDDESTHYLGKKK